MKRILSSGFPLAGASEKKLRFLLSSIHGDGMNFCGWKISRSDQELLDHLGLTAAQNHVKGKVFSDCVKEEHPLLLANILAGQGLSRMVLQSYPRQETDSTCGLGFVLRKDNQLFMSGWSRRWIASKQIAFDSGSNHLERIMSDLPGALKDASVWDSHVDLAERLAPFCSPFAFPSGLLLSHDGCLKDVHDVISFHKGHGDRFVLLVGSFDPLHIGHVRLLQTALCMVRHKSVPNLSLAPGGAFEISVRTPEKGTITLDEVLDRTMQFAGRADLVVSSCPLVLHKSQAFPGCVFVMGVDTADKLFKRQYYDSDDGPAQSMEMAQRNHCRFIVAGRTSKRGMWKDAREMDVPLEWRHLFSELEESQFRMDISSYQIRKLGFSL